jgi:1-hydroxycarotenoid 3,4-desaturase
MSKDRVVVIGAGAGGLVAAADLARRGAEVTVIERAATPGGKMRRVLIDGDGSDAGVDAGPTVFTMRWIFEGLFADCGTTLSAHLDLMPADILARHAWRKGGRLDLFGDIDRSADAIGTFSSAAEAQGYRNFCARSADIYRTLRDTFITSERPSNPLDLVWRVGIGRLDALWRTAPMKTMSAAIAENFRDPRLRQLFGRYATYCGSSPFLAPATLMLVAHVEQEGVWLVKGGMRRVADALQELGEAQGARFRFGTEVREILVESGRVSGALLASGERIEADAVVFNGDVAALADRFLGNAVTRAVASTAHDDRSLSAITWCLKARTRGFPLVHHNVFFAEDYAEEFAAIFRRRVITDSPTVYICAQDRCDLDLPAEGAAERLLVLINAPPDGDIHVFDSAALAEFGKRTFGLLAECGLMIDVNPDASIVTTPQGFNELFPATGGALYGRASHGSQATFQRPGATTRIPGLYLAGGSVHPGPGVPMAAMSGRIAAARVLEDLAVARGARRPAAFVSIDSGRIE